MSIFLVSLHHINRYLIGLKIYWIMARVTGDKSVGFAPKGRLRDVVIRKTRVGLVVSRYDEPSKSKKKKSVSRSQLNRREVFGILQRMANVLKEVNSVGFRREVVYSAHTRFLHYNYAIVDISDEGVLGVDYESMQLSAGTLRQLKDVEVWSEGRRVEVRWRTDDMVRSDGYHHVAVVAYCPEIDRGMMKANVVMTGHEVCYRKDGQTAVDIPELWGKARFYLYAFAYVNVGGSKAPNASLTQFLGSMEI